MVPILQYNNYYVQHSNTHLCIVTATDMSFITQVGDSALTLAAWRGHTNIVVELVKAGAKLDLQNKVLN